MSGDLGRALRNGGRLCRCHARTPRKLFGRPLPVNPTPGGVPAGRFNTPKSGSDIVTSAIPSNCNQGANRQENLRFAISNKLRRSPLLKPASAIQSDRFVSLK